jgi:hypothetical protein
MSRQEADAEKTTLPALTFRRAREMGFSTASGHDHRRESSWYVLFDIFADCKSAKIVLNSRPRCALPAPRKYQPVVTAVSRSDGSIS